jgi:protocadherin Fat 4
MFLKFWRLFLGSISEETRIFFTKKEMSRSSPWKGLTSLVLLFLFNCFPSPGKAQSERITFLSQTSFTILEEQPFGTFVGNFIAFYTSGGQSHQDGIFSLSSSSGDHTNFTLFPSNGTLVTAAIFDRDAPGVQVMYSFDVSYTTPSGSSDSVEVVVRIGDINDNTPSFVSNTFNVSVYEATSPGVTFGTISASDPDRVLVQQQVDYDAESIGTFVYTIENGRVIYDLLEGEGPRGVFNLHPDDGTLTIADGVQLDYDILNYYNYTVRARDGDNRTDYADLLIHVLDSNNHPPVIHGPLNVSVVLPEDTPPGRVIVDAINATDDDHGSNEEITFRISSGDPRGFFTINDKTGQISTVNLDREFSDFFTLRISATDGGTPSLSDMVMVHVTLLDINDSPPQFSLPAYTAQVVEGGAPVKPVTTVTANDPDLAENGTVTFSLLQTDLPFTINPTTGEIATSVALDREDIAQYLITVVAIDNSSVDSLRLSSEVNVTVSVADRNDNAPYFDVEFFKVEILDNTTVGTLIFTMSAFDADEGANGEITWQVLGGSGRDSDFRFNTENGRVFVNYNIRYELQSQYNYSIRTWDKGNPRSSNDIILYIVVHDVNTRRPRFYQSMYNATLYENASVGEVVLNVSAFDNDVGPIGELRYRIITPFDEAGGFAVDPVSGRVSISQPLDYDFRAQIQFQIEVYDGGFPQPRTDVANVTVDLLDVNDNCPDFNFNLSTFFFQLSENSSPPQLVANVSHFVVDPDTGSGGVFNYSISRGGFEVLPPEGDDPIIFTEWVYNSTLCNNTNITGVDSFGNETFCNGSYVNTTRIMERGPVIHTHFEFDMETGLLTSGRVYDREIEPYVIIEFAFQDYGTPPLYCRHNVTVEIVDDNDNNPYFLANESGSIIEYNQIGEQIVTISAADDDIGDNARITYVIVTGNNRDSFAIHPDNGTVYAAVPLNKTVQRFYTLTIMAVDNGTPRRSSRSYGYVHIEVLDFNDNPPQFAANVLGADVPENNVTEFYTLFAVDEDEGSNSNVTYSLLASDDSHRFTLDSITGVLETVEPFDAENDTVVLLNVVAVDMGLIPLSSMAVVMVTIVDENDNGPYFPNTTYNVTVEENSSPGTHVLTVEALDEDRDEPNNKISYSLDNLHGQLFTINVSSGVITVAKTIDREISSSFTFKVFATDGGNPPRSDSTMVTVSVSDVNDNPPVFSSDSLQLTIVEDSPPGSYVGTLVTTDADEEGNNTAVVYDVVVDYSDGRFVLDGNSGNVTATVTLNREEREMYDLVIRATDQGIPTLSTEKTVRIIVADANDHNPVFNQSEYASTIPEDTLLPFLRVSAFDTDVGVNGDLRYSITGADSSMFGIAPVSGDIFVAIHLDYESRIKPYSFIVVATDNGTPPRSASASILVTVTDVNDNPPLFTAASYTGSVQENFAIGTKMLQVAATDVDTGSNSEIRFSLENGYGNFAIHPESGVIYTIGHLDHETASSVTLVVVASNPFAPVPQNSTTDVTISITDINDNHPSFDQSFYELPIKENTPMGSVLTRLTAVDGDLAENGSVQYDIIAGNDFNHFNINSSTGELYLTGPLDYETPPHTYILLIRATDGSPQQLSNYTSVAVIVDDVNDVAPMFALPSSTASVGYGVTIGTEVVTLVAIDSDTPSTSPLTYSIVAGNEDSLFSIPDSSSGRIETTADVSMRSGSVFVLGVEVSDGARVAQHNATIEIVHPSAGKPVFDELSYSDNIPEGASPLSNVLSVFATGGSDYFFFEDDNDIHDDTFTASNLFKLYGNFRIDSTGMVQVAPGASFDYEAQNVYQLNIASNNTNGFTYTLATVQITDVNDNSPRFPVNCYVVAVPESTRSNSVILQLSAEDSDGTPTNRAMLYSLISSTAGAGVFGVDASGEVRLSGTVDFDSGDRNFTLVVQVSDADFQNVAAIDVIVTEDNDNVPTLSQYSYTFTFNETTPSGTVLNVDLTATDADFGTNAEISYGLTGNLMYTDIQIDPHSGYVELISDLDWEQESDYLLQVHVTDMGNPPQEAIVFITLHVLDFNDNDPKWESNHYTSIISENTPLGTEVIRVFASDEDQIDFTNTTGEVVYHITNGLVRYSITAGDPEKFFAINDETGVVTVNKLPDRETFPYLNITLTATDGGGRHANATLTVTLLDVNDNPPMFTMATYTKFILENSLLNSSFLTVVAYDPDVGPGSNFNYSIHSGSENGIFALNSTTGELDLLTTLNREHVDLYNLTVVAMDTGIPMLTGTTQVVIHVQDENDHAPQFTDPSYSILVPENESIAAVVLRVSAEDADFGLNSAVVYRIFTIATETVFVNETFSNDTEEIAVLSPSDHFHINSTSGEVYVAASLDYETVFEYNLVIVATDSAPEDVRLSTTVELTVLIDDVNDNVPVFVQESFRASVPENAPQGHLVANVTAVDADIFDILSYSIVSGVPDSNSFQVNGNGTISVSGPIDREVVQEYRLRVSVSDTASPPHITLTTVTITVLDRNEHPPVFDRAYYSSAILENQPIGSPVTQDIAVTDLDAEAMSVDFQLVDVLVENETECVLKCGNFSFCSLLTNSLSPPPAESILNTFTVNSNSGVITTNTSFDREDLDFFVLVVIATDMATLPDDPRLSSSVCVAVEIRDVNDNDPIFTESRYLIELTENTTPPLSLLTLYTEDADLSPNIETMYRIDGFTRGGGAFGLHQMGELNLTGLVDREENPVINLTVVAENVRNPQRSASTIVTIIVTDVNDNYPIFEQSEYTVMTSEGISPGTVIAMVAATDPDLGRNAEIEYSITEGNMISSHFSINTVNGSVIVIGQLDRESAESHTLLITATDGGSHPLNSSVLLIVNVTDENDNAPIFQDEPYVASVTENSPTPVVAFTVSASDADISTNADVTYSIASVSPSRDVFAIGNTTGVLTVTAPLDAEEGAVYVINVVADNGPHTSPSLSTSTLVTILVIDVNDNVPLFSSPSFTLAVSENFDIGTSFFLLPASDLDVTERNSNLRYSISTSNIIPSNVTLPVRVDRSNGSILVREKFDYELIKMYEFDAIVMDTGIPPLSSTTRVTLVVQDENDNFPIFSQPSYSFSILENGQPEEFVGIVMATDIDTSVLRYYVEDGDDGSHFQIDIETGNLTTNGSLDREEQRLYVFNVTVVDTGTNDVIKMATTTVTVTVLDKNDNPPIFYSDTFADTIHENVSIGFPILNLTASDLDIGFNGDITYSLVDSVDSSHFRINSQTSELETASLFDRETQSSFSFTVQAVDGGESPNTATADVIIVILDINDNNPLFLQIEFSNIIDENIDIGTPVIELMASDADIDENGEYRFSLDGHHFDSFTVDPVSGVIETSAEIDYEGRTSYNFVAIVTDLGNPPLNSTVPVTIEIVDLNDNPPVFDASVYSVAISENSILSHLVFQIPATDRDATSNSDLRYTITHGNFESDFALDEEEGQITVARYLDHEVVDFYLMQLQVVDQGVPQFTATAELRVRVTDENDNSPVFPQQQFEFTIDELQDGESVLVGVVNATDMDTGLNAQLTYSITNDDFGGRFLVDSTTGAISATGPILFSGEKSFTIILQVADRGIPSPLIDTAAVHITINDINQTPPTTLLPHYEVDYRILENLIYLTASDADRNPATSIQYAIADSASPFNVDATGAVSSTRSSVSVSSDVVTVTVSDGELTSNVTVTLNGHLGTTNKPIFLPVAKTISIMETTPVNTIIDTVTTFPTGNDVIIRIPSTTTTTSSVYSNPTFRDGLQLLSAAFEVTSDGSIILRDPSFLDREERDSVIIPLEAVDQVTAETAYSTVTLVIADDNDSPPTFDAESYSVGVSELITEGSTLLDVHAYDLDQQGPNADIEYTISSGNDGSHFSINSEGAITVEMSLDRETQSIHLLVVRATNHQADTVLYTEVNVTVEVFDANDNTPMLFNPVFDIELLDNVTIGTEVFRPQAFDPDEGSNGRLVFALVYESDPGVFAVNVTTGAITTARQLSPQATDPSYRVTMTVTDRGAPIPLSSSSAILFDVYHVNHFPPVFESDSYFEEISEILTPGSDVLTVSAIDNDTLSGAGLRYSFLSGNEDGHFDIDQDNGIITVVTTLDYQQHQSYSLVVVASDNGRPVTMTATTVVNISVLDVNNHSPEFSQSSYETVVLENVTIGTVVGVVMATDLDATNIFYTISVNSLSEVSGEELFSINRTSGEITTLGMLDREKSHDHQLTITAVDTGYPTQRYTSVPVRIVLMDLNDSPPKFTSNIYTATVYRLQQVGTFVAMVTANDPDSIGNDTVYSFVSGNDEGIFEINSTNGLVTVAREIPERSACYVCTLVVMATDGIQGSTVNLVATLSPDGMYCEGDFCTTIANRTRIRCPENLEPSSGGHLCIAYSCTSMNTYPCVTARTCVANGYSCVGVCPKGEAVCPTTDICHPVTMETTCDGSNTTCLSGQVLIQNANGIRSCRNPASLSSPVARQCVDNGSVYCVLLDECSLLSSPHLCLHCPVGMVYCEVEGVCYSDQKLCCPEGEDFCATLDTCIPPTQLCKLPNVAPRVTQDLYLAEVMTSFDSNAVHSSKGKAVGLLISSTNETARDDQGEELGIAIVGVSHVPIEKGEWQFATCQDGPLDDFGSCGQLESSWRTVPSVTDSKALVLPPNSCIRFVRKTLVLEGAVWMQAKLWDGNQDGYISSANNLTRSQIPRFESTLPPSPISAFSNRSALVVALMHPVATLPQFSTVGKTLQFTSINEEERPLHNLGDEIEELVGDVTLQDLPVLDSDVIGGFPSVPDYLEVTHYQSLLQTNVRSEYFHAVAVANPPREQRRSARMIGQEPGVAISFDQPMDTAEGAWQVSTTGSTLLWVYLSSIIRSDSLLLLNTSARIRFLPAKDFHGNSTVRLQPWDGYTPENSTTGADGSYHVIESTPNPPLAKPNLNSVVLGLITVVGVEEGPVVTMTTFELDPIPYQIGYEYERVFTFRIGAPHGELVALESNNEGISQPLTFTIGQPVTIKRLIPATTTSTYLTFSVDNKSTTLEELENMLRRATLLQSTLGAFSDFSKDTFYGPGSCCYGNRPEREQLHGTQVQQVSEAVATDDDSAVIGLAVVGLSNSTPQLGVWQYYRSNYTDSSVVLIQSLTSYHPSEFPWVNFPTDLSDNSAFLLRPQDRVRFVPHPSYLWTNGSEEPYFIAKVWDLSLWQQEGEVPELHYHGIDTDPFSDSLRSRVFPTGRFSEGTVQLSVGRYGCDGILGSGKTHDDCCVCDGGGAPCNISMDTTPVHNNCSILNDITSSLGCDFVPFSDSELQSCSECLSEISIPTPISSASQYWNESTLKDCNSTCHGSALVDSCGICSGGYSNHDYDSDKDCADVCYGGAVVDDCGSCAGGSMGWEVNQDLDCTGVCGGPFVADCGLCYNPNAPLQKSLRDCTGECFGEAQIDACGVCYGGNSTVGMANSTLDKCGVCNGDGATCVGCDGVIASGRVVDACGVCGGNDCGCVTLTSATPTRGPKLGGTKITIKGAGFFRNSSSFDPNSPNCGVPMLQDDLSPIPVSCTFRTVDESTSQIFILGVIVNQSTITCTISNQELFEEYDILVTVDHGSRIARSPPLIYQTDDYSAITVLKMSPTDSPMGISPIVTFTGMNFLNTSYTGCLITGFSSCTHNKDHVTFVEGTFLSSSVISCQLPMATRLCEVTVVLSLDGQLSGRVPQAPPTSYSFTYGASPPAVNSVHFSQDLLNLVIDFDASIDLLGSDDLSCSTIFNPETLVAIGNHDAVCSYTTDEHNQITVNLPPTATVADGTEISFRDDVIVRMGFSLTVPIRDLSIPVNGSVNAVHPIAVIEGNPTIPPYPTVVRFHGYNSMYPGYRSFIYDWSVHVTDSSIQGYTNIVDYLDTLQPDASSISLNSDWFQSGVEYYLQLIVRNSQGHYSQGTSAILRRTNQSDSSLFVTIEGVSSRMISSNRDLFLKSTVFTSIRNVSENGNGNQYKWTVYEVIDTLRGVLREVELDGVATTTLHTLFIPSNTLNASTNYIMALNVTNGNQTVSSNVTTVVQPWVSEASLFGGSVTCVSHDDVIVLDTSLSAVNSDLGNPSHRWSCIQVVSQQPCYNVSDPQGGVIRINSGETSVELSARHLTPGVTYNFSLVIDQSQTSKASSHMLVEVKNRTGPDLFVAISPVRVVTATDRTVLRGWVFSESSDVEARWTSVAMPGYATVDLSDPSVTPTGEVHRSVHTSNSSSNSITGQLVNQAYLVLAPGSLVAGQQYLFQLTATIGGGTYSSFARIDFEVESAPVIGISVDPPTGDSLATKFFIRATDSNADPSKFPLTYRFGFQNEDNTFWISGHVSSPSLETMLPSVAMATKSYTNVIVQVADSEGNSRDFVELVRLSSLNISMATVVQQIQTEFSNTQDWVQTLASIGSVIYHHATVSETLDNNVVGVITEILFDISTTFIPNTSSHHELITQYLTIIATHSTGLDQTTSEQIVTFLLRTVNRHTFEFEIPNLDWSAQHDGATSVLNQGVFSGAQNAPNDEQTVSTLQAVEELMDLHPNSALIQQGYLQLIDSISTGLCSLVAAGEGQKSLETDKTQLSVQKYTIPSLRGVFNPVPCSDPTSCPSFDLGSSFSTHVQELVCKTAEGRTLQLCREVCLQSSIQNFTEGFTLSNASKNFISSEIILSDPEAVKPYSTVVSSLSVPFLSTNGNGYVNLSNLTSPVIVKLPLSGEIPPANESRLLCLYRQRGGGAGYSNKEWTLDNLSPPPTHTDSGHHFTECSFHHLTEFMVGLLPLPVIEPTTSLVMSSTPMVSSSSIVPTPTTTPLPPTTAPFNAAGIAIPVVLLLLILLVVVVVVIIVVVCRWYRKRRNKVDITDVDAQDTVAETESVKIADLRVPKDVIALLAEGKRELFGKVLVMPSVKLKELRDVIAGTFEERMEGKPFYLLTTELVDIEPALEPFQYLHIVYPNAVFIRMVLEHTETTLRHFCICGKVAQFECSQCVSRGYCGSECQLQHWNGDHGKECKRLAEKRRRREILERRSSVQSPVSQTTTTTTDGDAPSDKSKAIQDWRALIASRKSSRGQLRPISTLSPIREQTADSLATTRSKAQETEGVDSSIKDDEQPLQLSMKRPPKPSDPFQSPSSRPVSKPLPLIRQSSKSQQPPASTTTGPIKEKPMDPHNANSYYWNRFPAAVRQGQTQQLPPISRPPPVRQAFGAPRPLPPSSSGNFVPPQPLDPDTDFDKDTQPLVEQPRPPSQQPHTPSQPPLFMPPKLRMEKRIPALKMSVASITSQDLDATLGRGVSVGGARQEPMLKDSEDSESESTTSTTGTTGTDSSGSSSEEEDQA